MAGNVVEFTDANFQSQVLDSGEPVLVDFWAPWCPPCRQLSPTIQELADENAGSIRVGKVNIDESARYADVYGVESIPTLLIFKRGQILTRLVGLRPKELLQEALEAAKFDRPFQEKPPMAGNVVDFTDANFQAEVIESAQPVLVDFWAPWCGPCLQLTPMIEQLADEYAGSVKVGKVNIDVCPRTSQEYGVYSLPTLMVFKGGQIVSSFLGPQPKGRLQEALDAAKG